MRRKQAGVQVLRIAIVVSLVCGLFTGGVAIAGMQKTVEGKVDIRHEAGMTWFYVDDFFIGGMGLVDISVGKALFDASEKDQTVIVTGTLDEENSFNSDEIITVQIKGAPPAATPQNYTDGVRAVRNGFIPGYETTTIGKAFDASFDDPKWTEFESEKGARIVDFEGKISEGLRKSALLRLYDVASTHQALAMNLNGQAIDAIGGRAKVEEMMASMEGATRREKVSTMWGYGSPLYWPVGQPVSFQWTYNLKTRSFDLSYMGAACWNNTEGPLDVIFNY